MRQHSFFFFFLNFSLPCLLNIARITNAVQCHSTHWSPINKGSLQHTVFLQFCRFLISSCTTICWQLKRTLYKPVPHLLTSGNGLADCLGQVIDVVGGDATHRDPGGLQKVNWPRLLKPHTLVFGQAHVREHSNLGRNVADGWGVDKSVILGHSHLQSPGVPRASRRCLRPALMSLILWDMITMQSLHSW